MLVMILVLDLQAENRTASFFTQALESVVSIPNKESGIKTTDSSGPAMTAHGSLDPINKKSSS
jgi:hypothetical protein